MDCLYAWLYFILAAVQQDSLQNGYCKGQVTASVTQEIIFLGVLIHMATITFWLFINSVFISERSCFLRDCQY